MPTPRIRIAIEERAERRVLTGLIAPALSPARLASVARIDIHVDDTVGRHVVRIRLQARRPALRLDVTGDDPAHVDYAVKEITAVLKPAWLSHVPTAVLTTVASIAGALASYLLVVRLVGVFGLSPQPLGTIAGAAVVVGAYASAKVTRRLVPALELVAAGRRPRALWVLSGIVSFALAIASGVIATLIYAGTP